MLESIKKWLSKPSRTEQELIGLIEIADTNVGIGRWNNVDAYKFLKDFRHTLSLCEPYAGWKEPYYLGCIADMMISHTRRDYREVVRKLYEIASRWGVLNCNIYRAILFTLNEL